MEKGNNPGKFEINPAKNPAVLDTVTWDREAAWKIIDSIELSYWESAKKSLTDSKPIPDNQKVKLFKESMVKYEDSYLLLSRLRDGQEVFIGIGGNERISAMGRTIGVKRINDLLFISGYPTDALVINNFCTEIKQTKGPKALGIIPRLGIGVRMSTSVWPAIWSAMNKESFSSNAIQNSIRELNLLEDLRAGKLQRKNYLFSFGEVEEGHTGSTYEGLWVYGVLDSLKHEIKQNFGADADHIQIKRGKGGIERAFQIANAARYYSFYTLDISDILDYGAINIEGTGEKYFGSDSEKERIVTFHKERNKIGDYKIDLDRGIVLRLIGKYWIALNEMEKLYRYIIQIKNGAAFDLEMSIDENPPGLETCECITSEAELIFIINEMKRRNINLTHVAPNFGVEKGIDYRCPGGLEKLKVRIEKFHRIASSNNIMLDCHSGDDLSSDTRKVFGKATGGNIHFKISPSLQNIFAETVYDYNHDLFEFWWDATVDYVRKKADEGSDFAADLIRKLNSQGKTLPSPYQDLFHYYCFAPVGLRDSSNRYLYREWFYCLPDDFYKFYQERVEKLLTEVAFDVFGKD